MPKKRPDKNTHKNLYNQKFFEELFDMLNLKNIQKQKNLKSAVISAQALYSQFYQNYKNSISDSSAKKEIKRLSDKLDESREALLYLYKTQVLNGHIVVAFGELCNKKYPELKGLVSDLHGERTEFFTVLKPLVLVSMLDALSTTLQQGVQTKYSRVGRANKSQAIEWWLMGIFSVLEDILGRPLKQRRYEADQKQYTNKKGKLYDSDILLFILKEIDPDAKISQIETAIKETKKDRLNPPWLE